MDPIDTLAQELGMLTLVQGHHKGLMARPAGKAGLGSVGKKFMVRVNTFEVKPPSLTCYHYDVKIGPTDEKRPARLNRSIWAELVRAHGAKFGGPALAYDGKAMAYSPKKLDGNLKHEINLPEEDGKPARNNANKFTVTLTLIRPIDLSALATFIGGRGGQAWDQAHIMSAVQALNVVIQHGPMMSCPSRGASFFLPHDNRRSALISKGVEMWRGYYTSLRAGPGKLFVNVDLSSHPMIAPGTLRDVIVSYGQGESRNFGERDIANLGGNPRLSIKLNRFLKGVKVKMAVAGKDGRFQTRKIQAITKKAAKDEMFDCDGKQMSVAAYFATHYRKLNHPEWPCVRVSKTALWPVEVCNVEDRQKFSAKLDPQQTADSLKLTTIKPEQRMPILRQGIKTIMPTNSGSALNQWGLNINPELMLVEARVLPAPEINYAGQGPQAKVRAGEGTWNMLRKKFIKPARVDSMIVTVFDNERFFPRAEVENAIVGFVSGLQAVGVQVKDQRPKIFYTPPNLNPSRISEWIKTTAKAAGFTAPPTLVVAFLPRKPCPEYAAIKRFGDVETGIATQCLAVAKARKGNPQYWANLALKVNVKLNGVNSTLSAGPQGLGPLGDDKVKTMVFGLDVSHPSPGSFAPSLAAVVGSLDKTCTQWGTQIKILPSRMEVIQAAGDMVVPLVEQYFEKNKAKPQRLICFRDGCSEGQFAQVLNLEVNLIRVALQKMDPSYKPKITYIVCAKRHHMSFFPNNPAEGDGKTGNVKAGTCVDTVITSPFEFDWYTQSHASLLGTSRSAHYTVLTDESNFTADQLQTMCYNLTYTYARCTRSVSYATPAYYADRACTRAALLLEDANDDAATSHSGISADQERDRMYRDYSNRLRAIHAKHKEALFFM